MQTASALPLPESLTAGDRWRIALSPEGLTPADGATAATLYLNGPGKVDATGAPDGTAWLFVIDEADTATLTPGLYHGSLRVTSPTLGPVSVPCGVMPVLEDLAAAAPGAFLTHEERCIPLLETAIEKRVRIDMQAYTITNTSATREELDKMVKLLRDYRAAVDAKVARSSGRMFRTHSVRF